MKKITFLPLAFLLLIILFFFHSFFTQGKLPIPSDTIVGLYHPFRDLYAKQYPNGIPYKNFLITDPVRQQYPWRYFAVSLEKQAQLPLWNPYNFGGTPLLANFQTAAFNPFNILLFIFPFALGWSILILLQQVLAGVFLYWYLSTLKLKYPARFLGSFVYVFCGSMIAWLEWGTLDQVTVWLPLILLSIDKLFLLSLRGETTKQSSKSKPIASAFVRLRNDISMWHVVLILSLICSFFAGHLQPFFYLFLIAVCYFFARWAQFGKSKKTFFTFLLLTVCFFILTAIQWIPTLQFIVQSARNADQLNSWQQPGWFIPWQNLVQFVAPDFFGNPTTLNYWGIWNYGEFIGYIGIFPLLTAIFALFYRRDKKTFFFGTFFFLSLIFSLPTIFAQIPYLLQLPFFATSQPTRLLFLTDFSLSILAALGLDYYLRSEKKLKILYPTIFMFVLFAGLWWFVLFGYKSLHIDLASILVSKHNLYFPTILLILVSVVVISTIFIKQSRIRNFLIIVLLCISVVDLFRFADKFIPFTPKEYLFPPTSALTYLQNQPGQFRIMETDSQILPPNFSIMYHLQSLDGYDPLYLQRYGELMSAIGRNKPDIHAPFGFNRIITPTNTESRLIDLYGVKYILSLSDLKEPKLVKIFSEGQTRVYKNINAFPRAFLVSKILPVSGKNQEISSLFDAKINLHTTAVVEDWNNESTTLSAGSAKVINYQANSVSIETQSSGDSFLVLTDTFYPTWHVMVDGKAEKIYRTDYNFRGVILTKGIHHVIFLDSLL
jgi:hypothetical protein